MSKFTYFVVTYSAGSKHERFQCLPWPERCRLLPPAPASASQLLSVLDEIKLIKREKFNK